MMAISLIDVCLWRVYTFLSVFIDNPSHLPVSPLASHLCLRLFPQQFLHCTRPRLTILQNLKLLSPGGGRSVSGHRIREGFMMTFQEEDGEVVPELRLIVGGEGNKGEYVKLRPGPCDREAEEGFGSAGEPSSPKWGVCFWNWLKLVVLCLFLVLLAAVFLKWVAPFFMDKEIIPIINWETRTFSTPVLAVLVFASVALFPTLLLPSSPSMWVAGMTFGYGYGFLLIMSGVAIGVSLPFFIGSLFHHKIQGWLEKCPKRAAILRSAGEGNWFNQFRAVALIRVSPFPYIIYNYCAVATKVKYGPYVLGSLVGIVPEIFVAIYTGILIQTLANERHSLSASQIAFNILGFAATMATTVFFTLYAKRQLKEIHHEDEPLLQ